MTVFILMSQASREGYSVRRGSVWVEHLRTESMKRRIFVQNLVLVSTKLTVNQRNIFRLQFYKWPQEVTPRSDTGSGHVSKG